MTMLPQPVSAVGDYKPARRHRAAKLSWKTDLRDLVYSRRLSQVIINRHGTGSHCVTQRPSDPGIQRPGDPVDPVTMFYNELQMSTYVADKRLQWARGMPVFIAVWRLHASGK